jgi:hypothetical protein
VPPFKRVANAPVCEVSVPMIPSLKIKNAKGMMTALYTNGWIFPPH